MDQHLRVGLIVPSSNTVMEPDFHRGIGAVALVSTTRILLEKVTRTEETRMLEDELSRAIRSIRTTAPDVVVFGCTSAGALGTLAHDREIENRIRAGTGVEAVTVLGAVIRQLSTVSARKVAIFTPYVEDLTNGIASSLSEAGYTPVKAVGMGIEANLEIGSVRPLEIVRFVESHIGGLSFDSVFLSCTNWQSVEILGCLREKLGVPVLSSNQAAMDEVRHLAASLNRAET